MTATSSRLSDFLARPNHARGHVLVDGRWEAKYQRAPDAQSPAGGASSSARDMAQWMRLHLGGGKVDGKQIIAADALAETYRPQMVSNPARDPTTDRTGFYGLGWGVSYDELGRVKLSHSGAFDAWAQRPRCTCCLLNNSASSFSRTPRRSAWPKRSPKVSSIWRRTAR